MQNLAVVILTRNEAFSLESLLKSLIFIPEILVIDDQSTDKTVELAKKLKIKVLSHPLEGNFATQRNWALSQCKAEWVFFLDADEKLSPELENWLRHFEPEAEVGSYSFHRVDHFWGRKLRFGEVANTYVTRLVNRHLGHFERPVHETWVSNSANRKLTLVLNHFPHPTLKEFIEHVNFYSSLNANYLHSLKRKTSVLDIMFTPLFKFGYTFFLKLGFLDREAGFVYSFIMSFHSFLTRAKLFILNDK